MEELLPNEDSSQEMDIHDLVENDIFNNTTTTSMSYPNESIGSSPINHSIGKDTYIVYGDTDESVHTYEVYDTFTDSPISKMTESSTANDPISPLENYTQTSKTILQLAEVERLKNAQIKNLQTQTSQMILRPGSSFGTMTNDGSIVTAHMVDKQQPETSESSNDVLITSFTSKNLSNPSDSSGDFNASSDMRELYQRLKQTIPLATQINSDVLIPPCLTPLTEESFTLNNNNNSKLSPRLELKSLNKVVEKDEQDTSFKLPYIQKVSFGVCPQINMLFSPRKNQIAEEATNEGTSKARETVSSVMYGAGETCLVPEENRQCFLPPIKRRCSARSTMTDVEQAKIKEGESEIINISEKIKELKTGNKNRSPWTNSARNKSQTSRACSPASMTSSTGHSREVAEKACEALCTDFLRKLKSSSWQETKDILEDIPNSLEKFWDVITEARIADLIRQAGVHVESPRTPVASTACMTIAAILKNTNYTKKPEFYEAITILLSKTGSFNKLIRRSANIALDELVCSVDLSQTISAVCVHGAYHKSTMVRTAAARLLVVSAAVGCGGRELIKSRPPTIASARKHLLRALASLIDDKCTETRKYAERLYKILRPLPNFEAFFLTDVDLELATKVLKKHDQLLKEKS